MTLVARIHAAGAASRTRVRDRRRAAGRRARSISAHLKLRNDEAKARVLAITGELTDLAEASAGEATGCWSTPAGTWPSGAAASGPVRLGALAELEVVLGGPPG